MRLFFFILILCLSVKVHAQKDSVTNANNNKVVLLDTLKPAKDSVSSKLAQNDTTHKKKQFDPHKATRRSAILPGWGQAYNHQYWKIPIVYGALAVPASLFVYNNKWYQETKEAYTILVNNDTANFDKINPKLVGLSPADLQYYRNDFRKNRDYSVIFFLLVWGLNVADATVFAHLKGFNVSDDLSMQIKPDFNTNTKLPAVSIALNVRDKQRKILPSAF
ncbi:MAG TPA: DUF5683 domain-containing protein [Parafilimonas sp.]|nr:DUF5683 domain-containing protein [Parafilimonas sp.]